MEIFNNTIIKLVVRQGTDQDRKSILLTSGEPAYTTDLKRFYIGNGTLSGGDVVGNLYQGSTTDLTTLASSIKGDDAYNSDNRNFYKLIGTDVTQLSNWQQVGGVYISGDNYINLSNSNVLTLAPLSANSISQDLIKGPIILDSGRISLSSTIPFQSVSTKTILVTGGLVSTANGSNSTGIAINPLSANIIIQSNQIYAKYNGSLSAIAYSKNINSAYNLSAGHYRFIFGPLQNANYIPMTQIHGLGSLGYESRVITTSLSSCDVVVLSSNGIKTDSDVVLLINY